VQELTQAQREETLRRVRSLALLMDSAWEIPGTTFRTGLDSLIGLIPGAGDLITTAFSVYIVAEARRLGVRRRTLARMAANVGVDALVGAIPLLGDIFDATFKANAKNLRLLELDLLKQQGR
jgi:hypothetical protein